MNKRQAKQTAHAIAHNVLNGLLLEAAVHEYACGEAPHCGPCERCADVVRIEAALRDIVQVHQGLGVDHRELG